MNTADRRAEIINILLVRRRITAKELADELLDKPCLFVFLTPGHLTQQSIFKILYLPGGSFCFTHFRDRCSKK